MDIDKLSIEIESSSSKASTELDKLASSFGALKTATTGIRLRSVANNLNKIAQGINSLNVDKIHNFTTALKSLATIKPTNLKPTLNQLAKLPKTAEAFDSVNMDKFAESIKRVTTAIRPLATEMEKVSNGFNALPTKINKIITQQEKLTTTNSNQEKSWKSLTSTVLKFGVVYAVFRRIYQIGATAVTESNNYIENLNLFTVSMGEYTEEALKYAQIVSEKLGIDESEFIRNQGVLMDMAKSFGMAAEDAYTMSKALTQLSYDFSSLYNLPIEESMTKIRSALAGKILLGCIVIYIIEHRCSVEAKF